jgi:hypothetical protein
VVLNSELEDLSVRSTREKDVGQVGDLVMNAGSGTINLPAGCPHR